MSGGIKTLDGEIVGDAVPVVTRMAELPGAEEVARRFVGWLLLAAVLPIPIFAMLGGMPVADPSTHATFHTLFLISVAHGGMSGLFWIDRRYRAHMADHKSQYYAIAASFAAFSVASVIVLGEPFFRWFSVIYIVWTVHHFSRQNWGVICLTALAFRAPRPTRTESLALQVACVGGAIGVLPNDLLFDGAPTIGLGIALLGLALSLGVAARQFADHAHPLRIAMTVAIGGFFLPIYLFGPNVGFVAIGMIHGAQYAVIMTVLAADRQQGSPRARIGGMLVTVAIYVGLYVVLARPALWGTWSHPAEVLLASVVIWHYMLDAGLWRLRLPFQRHAVRQSFPFLFTPAQSRG